MAIGLPFHDQAWAPAGGLAEGAPATDGRSEFAPGLPTAAALDLGLVRAVIEDGLLMVFGPDGDPVPPEIFGAAATEQPNAAVQWQDGRQVAAARVAAALGAQTRGHLGSGRDGVNDAWIEAMLGIGPQPEMAETQDLLAEERAVGVIAFGKELLITSPTEETFLIAEGRSRLPESIGLRLASEGPIAMSDLVARMLASARGQGSEEASTNPDECAAPACRARIEGDALVIDLPTVGQVHLAHSIDDTGTDAVATMFRSSGETATIADLARALGYPAAPPPAPGPERVETPVAAPPPAPEPDRVETPVAAPPTRSVPLHLALPDVGAAGPSGVALVVVRGLPQAASLSAGVDSGDGSWLLSPRSLAGLSLTVPPGLTVDLRLEVVAISVASNEGALTSAAHTLVVPLRADAITAAPAPIAAAPAPIAAAPAPIAAAPAPIAAAPAAIALGLDPQALSQSEPFDAVIVLDLPAGATLSCGTHDPVIDAWVVRPRELAELSVRPARGHNQDFTLSLFGVCLQPGSQAGPRLLAQVPVTVG
jgi:hypothetical protein